MLRLVSENDLPRLLRIEKLTQITPWTKETFERCWQVGYLGWVIELDEKVVAFIIVSMRAGEAHILNLCTHPDFQRRGFAMQLLEHVLSVARKKEVGIAYLEVRRSNVNAITLYDKLGFTQIGDRKNYYITAKGREDALVFAKDLAVQ